MNQSAKISIWIILSIVVFLGVLGFLFATLRIIEGPSDCCTTALNEKVKAQIDKLFTEENQDSAILATNRILQIKQGEVLGAAFGLRNTENRSKTFGYSVSAVMVSESCLNITKINAQNWIAAGTSSNNILLPSKGGMYYGLILIIPPKNTPVNCEVEYLINSIGLDSFQPIYFEVKVIAK